MNIENFSGTPSYSFAEEILMKKLKSELEKNILGDKKEEEGKSNLIYILLGILALLIILSVILYFIYRKKDKK